MKLVYVMANHHSGSTLTDMTLAGLENTTSLGEVIRLSMNLEQRVRSFGDRCQCKSSLAECSEWQARKREIFRTRDMHQGSDWSDIKTYPKSGAFDYRMRALSFLVNQAWLKTGVKLPDPLSPYSQRSWELFEQLAAVANSDYLIDSTKTVVRFLSLYRARPSSTILVYLTRDPRGVFNSHTKDIPRKDNGGKIQKIAVSLAHEQKRMMRVFDKVPDQQKIHIRYEDLCRDPDATLQKVANKLDISTAKFSSLVGVTNHGIPGSEHTKITSTALYRDESWKNSLSQGDVALVNFESADLIHRCGYES